MADNTVAVLQEIADLLRRRVAQTDEAAALTAERQTKLDERMAAVEKPDYGVADLEKMQQESEKRMQALTAITEKRMQANFQEKKEAYEEEREFRRQLISELQRHNTLLEQILSQNTP